MSRPHKCPKCSGKGWLRYDPRDPFAKTLTVPGPWKCTACNDGVIWDVTPAAIPDMFVKYGPTRLEPYK